MPVKRIAVDSTVLQTNRQTGQYQPPLIVEGDDMKRLEAYRVDILGPDGQPVASVCYRPTQGREFECYVETDAQCRVIVNPAGMVSSTS